VIAPKRHLWLHGILVLSQGIMGWIGLALPYGGTASAGLMYPPQRQDLIHVGPMRQSHTWGNEFGGVVCARVWLNPVSPDSVLCVHV